MFAPTDLRVEVLDREISPADGGLRGADVIIAGGAGCDESRDDPRVAAITIHIAPPRQREAALSRQALLDSRTVLRL